jgi:hypothetical protein
VAGCCAIAALKNPAESIVKASTVTAAFRDFSGRAHKIAYVIRRPHQVLGTQILKDVLKDVLKKALVERKTILNFLTMMVEGDD